MTIQNSRGIDTARAANAAAVTEVRSSFIPDLSLHLTQLELEQLDQQIGKTLDRIKQRNANRNAYAKDLERIQYLQGLIEVGKEKGKVIGDVASYDYNEATGERIERSTVIDGAKPTGKFAKAYTDGNGNLVPLTLEDEDKATRRIRDWDEDHHWFRGLPGETVPVYEVERKSLADEAARIDQRITDLASANEIDQIGLQRLISRRQEAVQRFNNILRSRNDAQQHVLTRT